MTSATGYITLRSFTNLQVTKNSNVCGTIIGTRWKFSLVILNLLLLIELLLNGLSMKTTFSGNLVLRR